MPAILLPQITGYSSLTARRSNALTARNMCPSPERLHNERRRIHSIRSAPTSAVEFDPTAVCFPISALPSNFVVVGPPRTVKHCAQCGCWTSSETSCATNSCARPEIKNSTANTERKHRLKHKNAVNLDVKHK